MEYKKVKEARLIAQKFVDRAKQVEKDAEDEARLRNNERKYVQVGKNSGALRRMSMELTRALAEMRKC